MFDDFWRNSEQLRMRKVELCIERVIKTLRWWIPLPKLVVLESPRHRPIHYQRSLVSWARNLYWSRRPTIISGPRGLPSGQHSTSLLIKALYERPGG